MYHFSKAFDIAHHGILLSKLVARGLTPVIIKVEQQLQLRSSLSHTTFI